MRFKCRKLGVITNCVSKIPKILIPKVKANGLLILTSELLNKSIYSFKLKIVMELMITIEVDNPSQIEPRITAIKMVPVIALKRMLLIYKKK